MITNKKDEEQETILGEEKRRIEHVVIGYYPMISYQPVFVPPAILLSNEKIQQQMLRQPQQRHEINRSFL